MYQWTNLHRRSISIYTKIIHFHLRGKHPPQKIEQKSRRQTRRGEMRMQEGDGPTPSEVLHARIEIEPTMTTVGTSTKTKTEGVGRRNQRRVAWKPRTMVERDGLERAVQEIRDTVRVKWIHIYGSCMHMRSFKVGLQRKIGDTGAQSSRIWACNTSRDWGVLFGPIS